MKGGTSRRKHLVSRAHIPQLSVLPSLSQSVTSRILTADPRREHIRHQCAPSFRDDSPLEIAIHISIHLTDEKVVLDHTQTFKGILATLKALQVVDVRNP